MKNEDLFKYQPEVMKLLITSFEKNTNHFNNSIWVDIFN